MMIYVEGEPATISNFLALVGPFAILVGLALFFVVWLFFQAADPENKRIQNERAPTIIEIAWLVPLILITIGTGGLGFVPAIFTLLFMRMYLVKLYQLFNPDWRTDGTSVGIPTLEGAVEVLDTIPTKEEIAEQIILRSTEQLVSGFRDDDSLMRRSLRIWPIGPVIEFHKRNHKKNWFVVYAFFVIASMTTLLLFLSIVASELIYFANQTLMERYQISPFVVFVAELSITVFVIIVLNRWLKTGGNKGHRMEEGGWRFSPNFEDLVCPDCGSEQKIEHRGPWMTGFAPNPRWTEDVGPTKVCTKCGLIDYNPEQQKEFNDFLAWTEGNYEVEFTDSERLQAKGLLYFLRYTIPPLLFIRNIAFVFVGLFFIFGPIYMAYMAILDYQTAKTDPSMYFPLEDLQIVLGMLTCMGLPLILVGIKVIPIAFRSAFQMYTGSVEFADDVIEKID